MTRQETLGTALEAFIHEHEYWASSTPDLRATASG
jgi:hypothetical protein